MTVSSELWQANLDLAQACLEHPFVQGIANGTLELYLFGHPLIDLLFGTLYNPPPGEFPRSVGVEQKVPANYLRQLVYPFR